MADWAIVTNPISFREAFLAQTSQSHVDESHRSVIHVLLYYVWRGAFESRAAMIQHRVQSDLGLLCLSIYKAFLPIIQTIRLGYPEDAFVLLRALMERIALLGYLHENRDIIPRYTAGKSDLNKEAMKWAKQHSPENWMRLYGLLSNVAHSRLEGPAGHIFDENPIGEAFRLTLVRSQEGVTNVTDGSFAHFGAWLTQ